MYRVLLVGEQRERRQGYRGRELERDVRGRYGAVDVDRERGHHGRVLQERGGGVRQVRTVLGVRRSSHHG